MGNTIKVIFFLISIIIISIGVFLVNWDIPAPVSKVEKVIPNERFQK